MINANVKKAMELDQYNQNVPNVNIGDIVPLSEIWDGEGEAPEDSYSYKLTENGEDGETNADVHINYCFKVIGEKENELYSLVEITGIDLI